MENEAAKNGCITAVSVKPERKTADVWDALTDTEVFNPSDADKTFHLKTYILNDTDNIVGKTETDFTVSGGKKSLVMQSVLTYSPVTGSPCYKMVCELYENGIMTEKRDETFFFENK